MTVDWRLATSIGSRSVASPLLTSRENGHIAVLELTREATPLRGEMPGTGGEQAVSREPVPVGYGGKGARTVLLGDKVIWCVNASLPAPAAVVEEEALEVAVSHLSPKGAQERKKEASLAMEQTRCFHHDSFTHRRPSFVRDRFLPERWRRAWRAIYLRDSYGSTEACSRGSQLKSGQGLLAG